MNSRGALLPVVVQRRVRVAHAGLGVEAADEVVHAGHLRRPLRAHERADRDFLQAGLGQRVEQAHFRCDGDVGALDLQPVAHAFFGVDDFGIAAHDFTFVGCKWILISRLRFDDTFQLEQRVNAPRLQEVEQLGRQHLGLERLAGGLVAHGAAGEVDLSDVAFREQV